MWHGMPGNKTCIAVSHSSSTLDDMVLELPYGHKPSAFLHFNIFMSSRLIKLNGKHLPGESVAPRKCILHFIRRRGHPLESRTATGEWGSNDLFINSTYAKGTKNACKPQIIIYNKSPVMRLPWQPWKYEPVVKDFQRKLINGELNECAE